MNKTDISRLPTCAKIIPQCLSEVPHTVFYRKVNLSEPFCVDGNEINEMIYHYDHCENNSIGQQRTSHALSCHCIRNPITDCRPYMYVNLKCNTIFISLVSIQSFAIIVALLLNFLIITRFLKNPSIRKRISNILLLSQAFADSYNCLLFLTPLIIMKIHWVLFREYPRMLDSILNFGGFSSFRSSLLMFLIIAYERCLAILKPLWHRVKFRKAHIRRLITVSWLIAVLEAAIACYLYLDDENEILSYYLQTCQVIDYVQIFTITVLFGLTFYKALVSIRGHDLSSVALSQKKKEFHLTLTFIIMYISFILCFLPLAVGDSLTKSPENGLKIFVFSFTSIVNPLLTLKVRKELRVCYKSNRNRSSITSTRESITVPKTDDTSKTKL